MSAVLASAADQPTTTVAMTTRPVTTTTAAETTSAGRLHDFMSTKVFTVILSVSRLFYFSF